MSEAKTSVPVPEAASQGWPVAGHHEAVALLQHELVSGHIAHAYLITGPEAVGRATLARLFAAALVCQAVPEGAARPAVACGVCRACSKVGRGVHPDVEVLSLDNQQASSEAKGTKNRNITIESIRALRERLSLRPLEAPWRVAIIEDAETMSGGNGLPAASALLKTLEEPPPYAVIILIAPDTESVLPTLVSRCRVIGLSAVGRDEIASYLVEQMGQPAAEAATIAALAQGRPGWAVSAVREPALLEARQAVLRRSLDLIRADNLARLMLVDEWAGRFSKADWRQAEADLTILTGCWRDVLLLRAGCDDLIVHQDLHEELRRIAEGLTLNQVHAALTAVRACGQHVRQNVSARLALEAMVLAWPAWQ